jgi:hypothetical protein
MANLPPIIQRTAAEWSASNQYIPRRTYAVESDTGRSKIGIGLRWSDTPYSPDVTSSDITRIVSLSQAAYDGLDPKDPNTLYVIT